MAVKGEKQKENRHDLREEEMNSGVGKILLKENERLRKEIGTLQKSLKKSQDKLEKLRSKNHELETDNSVLKVKLKGMIFPELIKFLSSTVGFGFGVSFYFNGKALTAVGLISISLVLYILMMYIEAKSLK